MSEQSIEQVTVRRAPKYGAFMGAGAILGAIVTFALTSAFETDPAVGFGATVGYFLLFGIPAGVALGAVVALLLDRRSRKRQRALDAQHESVAAPDMPEGLSAAVEADSKPQTDAPAVEHRPPD